MKKIICMFLSCVVLFSLSGCSLPQKHISEIIENYDKYSEALSDKGIKSKVEDAKTHSAVGYLNDSGKVLTVFSQDGYHKRQYVFATADKSNQSDSSIKGDICTIYREGYSTALGTEVRYRLSICIQFRNKETTVGVSYDNHYPSADKTAKSKFGIAEYFYLDGDFTPDLSEAGSFGIPPNAQERDELIKYFTTIEELSTCYNRACEYYETLCSVLED